MLRGSLRTGMVSDYSSRTRICKQYDRGKTGAMYGYDKKKMRSVAKRNGQRCETNDGKGAGVPSRGGSWNADPRKESGCGAACNET